MSGIISLSTISCVPDGETEIENIQSSVIGVATSSQNNVRNGDEITLSISGSISASGYTSINGKEYYPVVHYCIDGVEVAVSEEKKFPFNASFKVNGLSLGEHTLSVDVTGSSKHASYNNNVRSSVFTISE